jgi:hypothetical protein
MKILREKIIKKTLIQPFYISFEEDKFLIFAVAGRSLESLMAMLLGVHLFLKILTFKNSSCNCQNGIKILENSIKILNVTIKGIKKSRIQGHLVSSSALTFHSKITFFSYFINFFL